MRTSLFVTAALVAAPTFAAVSPLTVDLDPATLTLGGNAFGAVFAPDMPKGAGAGQRWATGAADVWLKLERDYDSGMSLALNTGFEVARDRLSYDNYGGNLVAKVYGSVQTGLGTVEIGMTDGAAYTLAVSGPVVDDITSIDNSNATFYIDPSTGRAFTEIFGLSSAVTSSLNYAKFSYYTPRIMGLKLGVSFTPSENRAVIPFLNNGPHSANRQKSIWDVALSYQENFEALTVNAYGALSVGHGDGKAPDHASLTEWGLGSQLDYQIDDDWTFAIGGAYRRANTFAFDIYDARTTGATESAHLSSTLSFGDWKIGGEYGRGTADGGGPVIGIKAWQGSVGYSFDSNWQVTAGWQTLHYDAKGFVFYTGAPQIDLSAAFLHLKFKV